MIEKRSSENLKMNFLADVVIIGSLKDPRRSHIISRPGGPADTSAQAVARRVV